MIVRYWEEVVELINNRLWLTLPVSPELALLGIQDDEQRPCCTKLFGYIFFYAGLSRYRY